MSELKPCPFGADHKVWIGVHDEEGNFHGEIGCEYESDAWSGLSYGLHHDGWGDCPLCTDDESETMGGMLFDDVNSAISAWNTRYDRTCHNLYCEGSDLGEGGFRCSRCDGEMYGDEPNYCCHCGAKVVSA